MTFSPLKESHTVQKIQRIINFLKVSFSHFLPVCMESSQNPVLDSMDFCFKNTFLIYERPGRMEAVAIQIWRAFQNMRRWTRKAFERGLYAIGLDMCSLTYPNCRHLSHASMPSSIMVHCALTRTVDPGFVIPVYDTVHWSRLRKPAWLLKESTRSGWVPAQQRNRGLFIQAVK